VAHRDLHTVTFVTKDDEGMRRLATPEITTHSFRKTVATLIDDEGFVGPRWHRSSRPSKVSTTQDRHMARDQLHTQVADLLDRTVAKAVNKR